MHEDLQTLYFRLSEGWITPRLARSAPAVRVSAESLPHPLLLYFSPISLGIKYLDSDLRYRTVLHTWYNLLQVRRWHHQHLLYTGQHGRGRQFGTTIIPKGNSEQHSSIANSSPATSIAATLATAASRPGKGSGAGQGSEQGARG